MRQVVVGVFASSLLALVGCESGLVVSPHSGESELEQASGPEEVATLPADVAPEPSRPVAVDPPAVGALGDLDLAIVDAGGAPVPLASAFLGETALAVGSGGHVRVEDLTPGRTIVRVEAAGFIPTTAVVDLVAGVTAQPRLVLAPTGEPVAFSGTHGAWMTSHGIEVEIPPLGVVDAAGLPVLGTVQAVIAPIPIAASPGPLYGVPEGDGAVTRLRSIAMAEISLHTDAGPAQLAPGAMAQITFPLPDGAAQVGDAIPAWWYDAAEGLWREEGAGDVLLRTDGELAWRASVAHFTPWNVDVPVTTSCVIPRVVDAASGNPLAGAHVTFEGAEVPDAAAGVTDASGETCLLLLPGNTGRVLVTYGERRGEAWLTAPSSLTSECSATGCSSVEISVPKVACVTGRVVSATGDATAGIDLRSGPSWAPVWSSSDLAGDYCLEIPAGAMTDVDALGQTAAGPASGNLTLRPQEFAGRCGGGRCGAAPDLVLDGGVLGPTAEVEVGSTAMWMWSTVFLSGANSWAGSAPIGERQWRLVGRPAGSAATLTGHVGGFSARLAADRLGIYVVEHTVTDALGLRDVRRETVEIVPPPGLTVVLTWETPGDPDPLDQGPEAGTDLDLHMLHPYATGEDVDQDGTPDGWFDQPFDCFWFNAHPNWESLDPTVDDDPGLWLDDTDSAGPELINLTLPEPGRVYRIGVHFWNDHGFGPSVATVRVYLDGVLAFEAEQLLVHQDMWEVARVEWSELAVVPILDGTGEPKVIQAYQHPFFPTPE